MLRLLVIEDSADRIATFREWIPPDVHVVYATSAGRALSILDRDPGATYAGVLLDHDLDQQVVADVEHDFTGNDVARRVAERIRRDVPILVHSVNASGGAAIQQLLEAAGFAVTRTRFDRLTRVGLLDWIEDVRAEYDCRSGQ